MHTCLIVHSVTPLLAFSPFLPPFLGCARAFLDNFSTVDAGVANPFLDRPTTQGCRESWSTCFRQTLPCTLRINLKTPCFRRDGASSRVVSLHQLQTRPMARNVWYRTQAKFQTTRTYEDWQVEGRGETNTRQDRKPSTNKAGQRCAVREVYLQLLCAIASTRGFFLHTTGFSGFSARIGINWIRVPTTGLRFLGKQNLLCPLLLKTDFPSDFQEKDERQAHITRTSNHAKGQPQC